MIAVLKEFLGLLAAVPKLKALIDEIAAWWTAMELERMKQDVRDGVKKAVYDHDQRELEKAINSTKAGVPSGVPGTVIRDDRPGVH